MIVNTGLRHTLNINPQDQYIKYLAGDNNKLYGLKYNTEGWYKIPGLVSNALVKSLDNILAYRSTNAVFDLYLFGINNYYINLKEFPYYKVSRITTASLSDLNEDYIPHITSNLKYLNMNNSMDPIRFDAACEYPKLKYINAPESTWTSIENIDCPNLNYIYTPAATTIQLNNIPKLKELYAPSVEDLIAKNLINLDWIYLGENYDTRTQGTFQGSSVKEAVYINIDRTTFMSNFNLTNLLYKSNILESQVIFKDDPGFKIPTPTNLDVPVQHIIQPLYNYNYNYNINDNQFLYDVCQINSIISNDDILSIRPIAFHIQYAHRSSLIFNNVESIGEQITVGNQWTGSFIFPKLKNMAKNIIRNGNGGTINLPELETFNGYIDIFLIGSTPPSENLVIELPKLKEVTGITASSVYAFIDSRHSNVLINKVFLDSLEYWNYKFYLLKVAANIVYIGPNIKDINEYLHSDSYRSSRTTNIYIDVPRATLETFSGYSKNFGSSTATTVNIICNDDPNWKSAEELRSEN